MSLTRQQISASFDWSTLSKARICQKQGNVLDWSFDIVGTKIFGTVRSLRKEPYKVELRVVGEPHRDDRHISGSCTCQIERDCLHAAAVALVAVEDLEACGNNHESEHGKVESEESHPAFAASWLKWLDSTLPVTSSGLVSERVIYILSVDRSCSQPRLKLDVRVAHQLKAGGYGVNRQYSWRQLALSQGKFISSEDRSIAKLFIATTSGASNVMPRDLPDDADVMDVILRKVIGSGRCFWTDDLSQPPLQMGLPKTAEVAWIVQKDGRQRTHLVIAQEGVQALYCASPWYVDVANGEAGPLSLPLPAQTVEALCAAPPIGPADAAAIAEVLQKLAPQLSLPLPNLDAETEVRLKPPRTCLTLLSHRLKNKRFHAGQLVEKLELAVLSFDYGFDSSTLGKDWRDYRWLEGNRSVIQHRDLAFEQDVTQRLTELGFTRVGGVARKPNVDCWSLKSENCWLRFVQECLPQLQALGWTIDVSNSFPYQIVEANDALLADVSCDDSAGWWFSLDLGVEMEGKRTPLLPILVSAIHRGGEQLSESDVEKLNVGGRFYARLPDGRLLSIPFDRVRQILTILVELYHADCLTSKGNLRISLAQAYGLDQGGCIRLSGPPIMQDLIEKIKTYSLKAAENSADLNAPDGFAAELRHYQKEGVQWMQFLSQCNLGGILADDMGLGKTVQTLAHILKEKRGGRLNQPCLVVCPTSVVPNWEAEAKHMAPDLNTLCLHGSQRASLFEEIPKADLVITSYPLLLRDTMLLENNWHLVVLDEAQAIKNANAKVSQAVSGVKAKHRLCLTGTPIENNLSELWSQFNFLMPGLLGDHSTFNRIFRSPIEKENDERLRKALSARIGPFLLRRRKEVVAPELPEKTVIVSRVELEGEQRDLYETVRLSMHEHVLEQVREKGIARTQMVILDALMKLRQVCCHPRLVKLEAASAIEESAKLSHLLEMVTQLIGQERRILLFSQFTSMLDLIQAELDGCQIPFVQIRGDTQDRVTPVRRFQNGEVPLFLISLKAGGTGLNLTRADTVIHFDPWWNPAVENQATDRAHRIGQAHPVFVYKLIAAGTIEERMLELQARKKAVADAVLDSNGADCSLLFDESDLEMLLSPLSSLNRARLQ